jgi:hypothetical protein
MKASKLRSDLARIKTVIEGDRRNVSFDVENMLKYDLMCVLGGYFDACSPPMIEIKGVKGGIGVCIKLTARHVKRAGVRPESSENFR